MNSRDFDMAEIKQTEIFPIFYGIYYNMMIIDIWYMLTKCKTKT